MANSGGRGALVGGTVVALVLCPIVLAVVAMLAGGLWAIFNVAVTVIRPGIIGFFAAILGGVVGTYASKAACDAVLKSYHQKVVFVELCVIALAGLVFELSLPIDGARAAPIAQLIAIVTAAFTVFWKEEAI